MILYRSQKLFNLVCELTEKHDPEWEKKWIAICEESRNRKNFPFDKTMSKEDMEKANQDDAACFTYYVKNGNLDFVKEYGRDDYIYLQTECPHCGDVAWGAIWHGDLGNGCQTINRCRKCSNLFVSAYHQQKSHARLVLNVVILIVFVILLIVAFHN